MVRQIFLNGGRHKILQVLNQAEMFSTASPTPKVLVLLKRTTPMQGVEGSHKVPRT